METRDETFALRQTMRAVHTRCASIAALVVWVFFISGWSLAWASGSENESTINESVPLMDAESVPAADRISSTGDSENTVAGEDGSFLDRIAINGFLSQGYINSDPYNFLVNDSKGGSFAFNEAGINLNAQVSERLRAGIQVFARELGDIGNHEITLNWAFGDYRWRDWLGIRLGRIMAPHGLYNESRDIDIVRTSIFLPQSIYMELDRATLASVDGVGLYGNIFTDLAGTFSYYLLTGSMNVDTDSGPAKQFNASSLMSVTDEFDIKESHVLSLQWQTPLDGLLLKYTYRKTSLDIPARTDMVLAEGAIPAGTPFIYSIDSQTAAVYSAEYTWNDLVIAAEYQHSRRRYDLDLLGLDNVLDRFGGYYVGVSYRIFDWLEMGIYRSELYKDWSDKDGDNESFPPDAWLKDTALSFRFDLTPNWTFKLEGHLMDGTFKVLPDDNSTYDERNWHFFAVKATYSF